MRNTKPLEQRARFKFDQVLKCDDHTNGFVETFNHPILNFSCKPIYTMLEDISKLVEEGLFRFEREQSWEDKAILLMEKK